jgi:L-serine deaminase
VQPTQALTLLNGEFAQARAAAFAARLQREAQSMEDQLARGIALCFGRAPGPGEVERLAQLAQDLRQQHDRTAPAALERCCLLLLNANEFLYLD